MASPMIVLPATCLAIVNSLYNLRWLLCPLLAVALAAKFNRRDVSTRKRRDGFSSKSPIRKSRQAIPELTTLNSFSIEPLPNFDWKSVLPIQLRPYKLKFFLTMGLEKSTPSSLIQIDCNLFTRLTLRSEILFQHPNSVRASTLSYPAVAELYTFLTSIYLPTRFPSIFAISSNRLHNLVSGATYPATPEPCAASILRTLGELVDEDFMFLVPDTRGALTLQGYVSCFASGFAMNGIFGKDLNSIHLKVPGYRENIERSMKRWFTRLGAGNIWRRANWTITLHGQLRNEHGQNQVYETTNSASRTSTSEESPIDISGAHLRTELQHIYRLPKSQAVVFSYKTLLYPLAEIKAEGGGEVLATAIEGLDKGNCPGMGRYKGVGRWGEHVVRYLRS